MNVSRPDISSTSPLMRARTLFFRTGLSLALLLAWAVSAHAEADWHGGRDWDSEDETTSCRLRDCPEPLVLDRALGNGLDAMTLFLSGEEEGFDLNRYYDDLEPPGQDGVLGRYSILLEDGAYFLVPAFAVLGVIYLLPEDVSNWERDDITLERGWEEWTDNVAGWQWDSDDAWINYIGHPYFGSTYFIYARHYGYSRLESLWFSFSISAFYEIALEAWAEPVSIQDMIFTPLLGWAVAEVLLPLEHRIHRNDDRVLGSRILGTACLVAIDPFGYIVPPIKKLARYVFSSDDIEVNMAPLLVRRAGSAPAGSDVGSRSGQFYGLRLTVTW